MKAISFGLLVVLAIGSNACANFRNKEPQWNTHDIDTTSIPLPTAADSLPTGQVIDTVECIGNMSASYALYIPAKAKRPMPVVYCFDPHGSGYLPVRKYKALADAYGFILVGSYNSKNGNSWDITEDAWKDLWKDTKARLPLDGNRVYTCGFSGGAKVASYIAMNHTDIRGVIAGGAGLPDGAPATDYIFTFTAVAGEGDMNLTDLMALNSELDKTHTRHRILYFNGKHEWAPEKTMALAFTGWQLDAMAQKLIPVNDTLVKRFVTDSKKTADAYVKGNQLAKAMNGYIAAASMLNDVSGDANWFNEQAKTLNGNVTYQQQSKEQRTVFVTEQGLKESYMRMFQQANMTAWTNTIADMQAKAKAVTPDGAMYQRLLAYLSLAFYSFSNQMINNNRNEDAAYVVALYKLADPANSEAWYFSALLQARSQQPAAAEADLLKAVACGFTDKKRLEQQPEFTTAGVNLAKVKAGMGAGK